MWRWCTIKPSAQPDVVKTLNVILNKPIYSKSTSKAFMIHEQGFRKDTVCFVDDLERIITQWFAVIPVVDPVVQLAPA